MPRTCQVCGKIYSRTIKRSHSMRPSIHRLKPNLQYTVVDGLRIKSCTRCMKTASKATKVKAVAVAA